MSGNVVVTAALLDVTAALAGSAPRRPPRGKVALFCPSLLEDDIVKICQRVQFSQRLGFVQSVWIDWSTQFLP